MSVLPLKQKVYNVISAHLQHREFSRGDVLEYIDQDYPDTNHGSVQPSDYLYDDAVKSSPSNKGHDNYDLPRFLKRLGRNRYRFGGWDGVGSGGLDAPVLRKRV